MLISRNMGQDAQFDLWIVRTQQDTVFLFWDKGLTNKTTLFQTDRNVLQVGIHTGQTACLRQILYIAGMDLPIFQNPILKTDDIGRLDLSNLAVFKNLRHNRCNWSQAFQDINGCWIAGFCLLSIFKRESQFFKENDPQLFWRIDIKLFSCKLVDFLSQALQDHFVFHLHIL